LTRRARSSAVIESISAFYVRRSHRKNKGEPRRPAFIFKR
jgi:hypothetical protein